MRLADTAHTCRPWRIHEIAPDFRLEDVWELPWRGGADDFRELAAMLASRDPARTSSRPVRLLFAIRERLGQAFGWDDPVTAVASLRDRLPPELGHTAAPEFADALPFKSLYLTDDEFAAEAVNRTMHGVLHLGLLPDGRAQMAILVKPNGVLGNAYMAAIKPFRHLIVYPALLREWERAWRRREAKAEEARYEAVPQRG